MLRRPGHRKRPSASPAAASLAKRHSSGTLGRVVGFSSLCVDPGAVRKVGVGPKLEIGLDPFSISVSM